MPDLAPNVDTDLGSEIYKRGYELVRKFYELPEYNYDQPDGQQDGICEAHREVASEIAVLMAEQIVAEIDLDGINHIVDVLPLRGALALVPPVDATNVTGCRHSLLPIDVKREQQEDGTMMAVIYWPTESLVDQSIQQTSAEGNAIFRILDMGGATGVSTALLVKRLVDQGVPEKNIVVQCGVATEAMAELMIREFPQVTLLRLAEGEMPIEQLAKDLPLHDGDHLKAIKMLEATLEPEDLKKEMYYLTKIRSLQGTEEFEKINPKDWGDSFWGVMKTRESIRAFVGRVKDSVGQIGSIIQFDDERFESLEKYYHGRAGLPAH